MARTAKALSSDAHAILGHRRLSIIDLAGGRQPLTNADRTIWLVCNGEIYNYRELRADLEARGQRFLTHSDCEVIIGLYELHGERLLEHLRGMFAFALWDARRQRLLLARDHLGQKPLYYAQTPRRFCVRIRDQGAAGVRSGAARAGSRGARSVSRPAPHRPAAVDVQAACASCRLRICWCSSAAARRVIRRYWKLEYQPKLDRLARTSCSMSSRQKIDESLRLHLVSDVPVGAFLSGGLDSSLLVAMLAKRVGVKDLPTFTVGLPHPRFDEAPHARAGRAAVRHRASRAQPVAFTRSRCCRISIYHLDEPSDPLSLCAYHVAELARRYVKVVIGGDGGDELFGGYDRYYGNLYAESLRARARGAAAPRARPGAVADSGPAGTRASAISCAGCTGCRSCPAASAMRRA